MNKEVDDLRYNESQLRKKRDLEDSLRAQKCNIQIEEIELEQENQLFENLSSETKVLRTMNQIYDQLPLERIKILNMKDGDKMGTMLEQIKSVWNNKYDA